MRSAADQPAIVDATNEEIDAIGAEFGGITGRWSGGASGLTQIVMDSEAAVSKGFVRGNLLPFRIRESS